MGLEIKRLGVCLAAAVALSLAVTGIASAAQFTSSSYPTTFSGEGVKGSWRFNTEVGYSECKASSTGVLSAASSTLTLSSPALNECISVTGNGTKATTTNMEGCQTLLHITEGSGDTYTGKADL